MTDELFVRICRDNPEIGFELTASGELVVVTPTGSKSGHREAFTLPNGAKRMMATGVQCIGHGSQTRPL